MCDIRTKMSPSGSPGESRGTRKTTAIEMTAVAPKLTNRSPSYPADTPLDLLVRLLVARPAWHRYRGRVTTLARRVTARPRCRVACCERLAARSCRLDPLDPLARLRVRVAGHDEIEGRPPADRHVPSV